MSRTRPSHRMLNKRQSETSRAAIQTTQLINRLQSYVFALPDIEPEFNGWLNRWQAELPAECMQQLQAMYKRWSFRMDPAQVRAAEVLIRKNLPDLKATELTGTVTHMTYDQAVLEIIGAGTRDERRTEVIEH